MGRTRACTLCQFGAAGRPPLWWAIPSRSPSEAVSFNYALAATQFLLGVDRVAPAAFSYQVLETPTLQDVTSHLFLASR
jgi:hypothetical protein